MVLDAPLVMNQQYPLGLPIAPHPARVAPA
jgi:hypothetical protein